MQTESSEDFCLCLTTCVNTTKTEHDRPYFSTASNPVWRRRRFSRPRGNLPFGTHVAVVEVEPDSGEITVCRYVAVDDVGTQADPKLVEGQIVGGVAQAVNR